jgi:hypothetical protein
VIPVGWASGSGSRREIWHDVAVLRWLTPIALVLAFLAQADAGVFKPRGPAKKGAAATAPAAAAKKQPAATPRRVVTKVPVKNSRVATKARPDDLTPDPAPKKKAKKAKKESADEEDVIVVDDDE